MNSPNICELITHSSLISDLSEEQCGVLSSISTERSLDDKEVLIAQGKIDETLHIVSTGGLIVEHMTGGGNPVTLYILKPGDLAGELGFIDGTEHSATLRAMGPTSVISIERKNLESLLSSKPEVVYGLMRGIVRTAHRILREMNQQSVELNNYITKVHGRY